MWRPWLLDQHPAPAGAAFPRPPFSLLTGVRPVDTGLPLSLTHHVKTWWSPNPRCDTSAARTISPDTVHWKALSQVTLVPP